MNLSEPSIVPVPPPLLTSWPYYKLQTSLQLQDFGAVLAGRVPRFRPPSPPYTRFRWRCRAAAGDNIEIQFRS
jgi:hypothetical protein